MVVDKKNGDRFTKGGRNTFASAHAKLTSMGETYDLHRILSIFLNSTERPSHPDLGAVDDEVLAVVGHFTVVHAVHGVVPVNKIKIDHRDHQ